jgi:adenylate cyclase
MSSNNLPLLDQIRARVSKTLKYGIQLNISTEESKKLLRRHVNRKTNLVIMFVDINKSTQMSLSLPENRFSLMIQTFAQEISIAVSGYGGYVFKYEGDAAIVLFPAEYDQKTACKNALICSTAIQETIKKIVNPEFRLNQLPEITLRIGLDYGNALVVLYGKSLEKAHIDLIGWGISMAAKIASIAQPNQILAGESIYNTLKSFDKDFLYYSKFVEVDLDLIKWNYPSHVDVGSIYRVYEYIEN